MIIDILSNLLNLVFLFLNTCVTPHCNENLIMKIMKFNHLYFPFVNEHNSQHNVVIEQNYCLGFIGQIGTHNQNSSSACWCPPMNRLIEAWIYQYHEINNFTEHKFLTFISHKTQLHNSLLTINKKGNFAKLGNAAQYNPYLADGCQIM